MGRINVGGGGGISYELIQEGTLTLTTTQLNVSIPSPIDLTKHILQFSANGQGGANPSSALCSVRFSTDEQIRIDRASNVDNAIINYRAFKVEGAKQIISGARVMAINESVANITIPNVVNSKCKIYYSYTTDRPVATSSTSLYQPRIEITSPTNLRITRGNAPTTSEYNCRVSYHIVESN